MLDRLLPWRSTDDDTRPPEPDPEVEEHETEIPIYEVSAAFVDGSTETYRACYINHGERGVELTDGGPRTTSYHVEIAAEDVEFIPYETLTRPVETEQVGTWIIEYRQTYRYKWHYRGRWKKRSYPEVEILSTEEVEV